MRSQELLFELVVDSGFLSARDLEILNKVSSKARRAVRTVLQDGVELLQDKRLEQDRRRSLISCGDGHTSIVDPRTNGVVSFGCGIPSVPTPRCFFVASG